MSNGRPDTNNVFRSLLSSSRPSTLAGVGNASAIDDAHTGDTKNFKLRLQTSGAQLKPALRSANADAIAGGHGRKASGSWLSDSWALHGVVEAAAVQVLHIVVIWRRVKAQLLPHHAGRCSGMLCLPYSIAHDLGQWRPLCVRVCVVLCVCGCGCVGGVGLCVFVRVCHCVTVCDILLCHQMSASEPISCVIFTSGGPVTFDLMNTHSMNSADNLWQQGLASASSSSSDVSHVSLTHHCSPSNS